MVLLGPAMAHPMVGESKSHFQIMISRTSFPVSLSADEDKDAQQQSAIALPAFFLDPRLFPLQLRILDGDLIRCHHTEVCISLVVKLKDGRMHRPGKELLRGFLARQSLVYKKSTRSPQSRPRHGTSVSSSKQPRTW